MKLSSGEEGSNKQIEELLPVSTEKGGLLWLQKFLFMYKELNATMKIKFHK